LSGKSDDSEECADSGASALVRCYAELNDYLPDECRQRDFSIALPALPTVGRLIDDLGIPAAAVEVVLVDGVSSRLDHDLGDGDRVSLYPLFESFDISPMLALRERPLRQVRFVADAHLGRLARHLRLLGFDTLFENDPGDAELARISAQGGRILLSRDRGLLERRIVTHGLWIPEERPREQVAYVVARLDLKNLFRPFTRCTLCNDMLVQVAKDSPELRVPPRVRAVFETFWRCNGCGRVYWQGSHYDRLRAFVEKLGADSNEPDMG